ncbi:hypothetical protein ACWEQO_25010 [Streptomyces sp. NPDC004051]
MTLASTPAVGREARSATKRQQLPDLTGMRFIADFLLHLTMLAVHTPHGIDVLHPMSRELLAKARLHPSESETDDAVLPTELTAQPRRRDHRVAVDTPLQRT